MHKTNSVSGPHRPDLDTSEAGRRDFRRNLNRLVEVFRLDEEVAAELLLRLGKRAIGGRDFTISHPDRRRYAGGLKAVVSEKPARFPDLVRECGLFRMEFFKLGLRQLLRKRLVLVDQT